jgi:hypothetical protein
MAVSGVLMGTGGNSSGSFLPSGNTHHLYRFWSPYSLRSDHDEDQRNAKKRQTEGQNVVVDVRLPLIKYHAVDINVNVNVSASASRFWCPTW